MKECSATVVLPVAEFYAHAADSWQQAYNEAAHDLIEPLQVRSTLFFCREVDEQNFPVGSACRREDANYACCTVTVKDLSDEPDTYNWEPLCNQRRPKAVRSAL